CHAEARGHSRGSVPEKRSPAEPRPPSRWAAVPHAYSSSPSIPSSSGEPGPRAVAVTPWVPALTSISWRGSEKVSIGRSSTGRDGRGPRVHLVYALNYVGDRASGGGQPLRCPSPPPRGRARAVVASRSTFASRPGTSDRAHQ